MASLTDYIGSDFDAVSEAEKADFDPIPEGVYTVAVTESEMKSTKAGTGRYLQLRLSILDGDYSGRTLLCNLNLDNPSDVAVKIAKAQLGAICKAVGLGTVRDSAELHDLPFAVKVVVLKDRGDGKPGNDIKKFMSRADAAAEAAKPVAGGEKPPWMK